MDILLQHGNGPRHVVMCAQLKAWEEYTSKLEEKYVALMTEHEAFQRELAAVRGILDDGTDAEIHGKLLIATNAIQIVKHVPALTQALHADINQCFRHEERYIGSRPSRAVPSMHSRVTGDHDMNNIPITIDSYFIVGLWLHLSAPRQSVLLLPVTYQGGVSLSMHRRTCECNAQSASSRRCCLLMQLTSLAAEFVHPDRSSLCDNSKQCVLV